MISRVVGSFESVKSVNHRPILETASGSQYQSSTRQLDLLVRPNARCPPATSYRNRYVNGILRVQL